MPRGVMTKRAWMRPYSSSAADSIDSCCSSEKPAVAGLSTSRMVSRELVVRHLRAQSGEVEVVLDEVLLDFRKELVALER